MAMRSLHRCSGGVSAPPVTTSSRLAYCLPVRLRNQSHPCIQHIKQRCRLAAAVYKGSAPRKSPGVLCGAAGADAAGGLPAQNGPSLAAQLIQGLSQLLQAHFLPLALLSALLLGVTWPQLGLAAANLQIPLITTFGIFIIQVGWRAPAAPVKAWIGGGGRPRACAQLKGACIYTPPPLLSAVKG